MSYHIHLNTPLRTFVLLALFWLFPLVSHAATIEVNIRLQTESETLYTGTVYISEKGCTVTDSAGTSHEIDGAKAICAFDAAAQIGQLEYGLEDYAGLGLFLNSIGDYVTDFATSDDYWSFFVNYEMASVGLVDYTVKNGDEVLLSFGPYTIDALRLKLPDNEILASDTLVVRVQRLGDAKSNTFIPVEGATVVFNDSVSAVTDEFGKVRVTPSGKRETVTIMAVKDGSVSTATTSLTVFERNDHRSTLGAAKRQVFANAGADFLKSKISDDGMILESQSLTEWAAMALSASGESAHRLDSAVVAYEPTENNGTTEIARHILALVALGYDPHDANGIDYVHRLKTTQSNGQFGSPAFINDDIFAGLALLASGEDGNAKDVRFALKAAKEGINDDGGVSFSVARKQSDVDTTAFFLQFVVAAQNAGNTIPIAAARQEALHFILQEQNLDGGFAYTPLGASNSASTAVVVQALNSLGRDPNDIMQNKRTGYNYLSLVQNDSGQFFYSTDTSSAYDALNTAYAIIGLMDKSLPVL